MATLLELDTIEANSRLPFDPAEAADVTAARDLRRQIRSAALKAAEAILDDAADPSGNTAILERIAWARQTVQNPDAAALELMRLALADAPDAAPPAAIVAVAESAIKTTVNKMVPRLAKGLQVSR